MVTKPKVILNCRSSETLLPALQKALQDQMQSIELKLHQSTTCPSRLSHIDEEDRLYFFFDEDVELPTIDYLEQITQLFKLNPELQILGGRYLPHPLQPYLAKSYNTQIEFWLFQDEINQSGLVACQNLPGGVWIISGQVKKYLQDWKEPLTWAGEDTFSIRWLQKKGLKTFYHSSADVFHYPRSEIVHFCKRAYLQGRARQHYKLKTPYRKINWNLIWKYRTYWAGWLLHQTFVELGSLVFKIKSFKAKMTPTISPVA